MEAVTQNWSPSTMSLRFSSQLQWMLLMTTAIRSCSSKGIVPTRQPMVTQLISSICRVTSLKKKCPYSLDTYGSAFRYRLICLPTRHSLRLPLLSFSSGYIQIQQIISLNPLHVVGREDWTTFSTRFDLQMLMGNSRHVWAGFMMIITINIMADLKEYASERLMAANEKELRDLLKKYKEEHLPFWKFGLFVAYNAASLVGMYIYGVKLRGKRVEPSLLNREKYTITNLFSRGVQHSLVMITLYLTGLYFVSQNTFSLELLRKLTEIQSTYHSFGLKFDPNYQDYLLFDRMRKFDVSEALIQQIKAELQAQKQQLVANGGLLPETIAKIKQTEELYLNRSKQLA